MQLVLAVPVRSSNTVMAKFLKGGAYLAAFLTFTSTAFAHGHLAEKGEQLYVQFCAECHGIEGDGNGPSAQNMSPPPANLLQAMQGKIISDEYLMWTIREGGENIHTDMPSFEKRDNISEDDAKAIVHYLWHAFK